MWLLIVKCLIVIAEVILVFIYAAIAKMTKKRKYFAIAIIIFSSGLFISGCSKLPIAKKQKPLPKVKISSNKWIQVNGPYGGWITDMEKSGKSIVAGTSFTYGLGGNGIYKISDKGISWKALGGTDRPITDLAVDPSNSDNITFVADNGFFITRDGGTNWKKIDLKVSQYKSVAVSPKNPSLLIVGTASTGKGQIFISEDDGKNWRQSFLPETPWSVKPIWAGFTDETRNEVTVIAPHPTDENIIIVGTNSALFKTTDKGKSWKRVDSTFHRKDILDVKINPKKPNEVYVRVGVFEQESCFKVAGERDTEATTNPYEKENCAGVYKSSDLGESWKQMNTSYFDPSEGGVFLDDNNPDNVYAIYSRLVHRSKDGGENWEKFFWTHDDPKVVNVGLERLLTGEKSSEIFLAGRQGLLHSDDDGEHFHDRNKGYIGSEVVDIIKTDNGEIYAGTYSLGMFKSTDKGQNWSFSSYRLENPYVMALAKHPTDSKKIFLTTNGGVYVSKNGAKNWEVVSPEFFFGKKGILPDIAHFHGIAFDPKNDKRIYVGGGGDQYSPEGAGISISDDGGKTWKLSNGGFETDVHVSKIVVDEKNPKIVYVTTQGPTDFGTKTGQGQGVYKSDNYGKSWKKINKGLETVETNTIAIDSNNSKILYIGTDDSGVFKSVNGGQTWRLVPIKGLPKKYGVGDIVIDSKNSKIVYVATVDYFRLSNSRGLIGDHGVYKSTNGGKTWRVFNEGLKHKGAFSLELDSERDILYVGTRGGGVYWRKVR